MSKSGPHPKPSPLGFFIRIKLMDKVGSTDEGNAHTMKSMAKELKMTPSFVSACCLGKKQFSKYALDNISEYLSLSDNDKEKLYELNALQKSSYTIKLKKDAPYSLRRLVRLMSEKLFTLDEVKVRKLMEILEQ